MDASGPLPQYNLEELSIVARLTMPSGAPNHLPRVIVSNSPPPGSAPPRAVAAPALAYPQPVIVDRALVGRSTAAPSSTAPSASVRDANSPATSTLEVRFFDAAAAVAALEDEGAVEPEIEPAPVRQRTSTRERIGQLAFVATLGGAILIVGIAAATRRHEPPPPVTLISTTIRTPPAAAGSPSGESSASSATQVSAPAVAPTTTSTPAPAPSPPPRPATGTVVVPPTLRGQTIVVDDNLVFRAQPTLMLACGRHQVRTGPRGKTHALEVPCGGNVTLTR